MASNGISDAGLSPLAGVLRVHPSLTALYLHSNKIVSFPVEAAMLPNLKFTTLHLHDNNSIMFPPRSITANSHQTLVCFGDLRRVVHRIANNDPALATIESKLWNERVIGNAVLVLLAVALINNSTTTECDLSDQGISSAKAMHSLTQAIINNPKCAIRTLNLSRNSLIPMCINQLCHLLRSPQCKITNLGLEENKW